MIQYRKTSNDFSVKKLDQHSGTSKYMIYAYAYAIYYIHAFLLPEYLGNKLLIYSMDWTYKQKLSKETDM